MSSTAADLRSPSRLCAWFTVSLIAASVVTACVGERQDDADTAVTQDTGPSGDTAETDSDVGDDDDTSTSDTMTTTGQDTAGLDAADDDTSSTDTGDDDATADTADTMVETGEVTVTIVGHDGPLEGVTVLTQALDGELLEEAVTDAAGTVVLDVVADSWLSADVSLLFEGPTLYTMGGVQPGDTVELVPPYSTSELVGVAKVLIDIANYPDIAEVIASTGCQSQRGLLHGDRAELNLYDRCLLEGAAMPAGIMIGWGLDANGRTTAIAEVDEALPDTESRFGPWYGPAFAQVEVVGVPDDLVRFDFLPTLDYRGVDVRLEPGAWWFDTDGTDKSGRIAVPSSQPAVIDAAFHFDFLSTETELAALSLETNADQAVDKLTVDAQTDLLPRIESLAADMSDAGLTLAWSSASPLTEADFFNFALRWDSPVGARTWFVDVAPTAAESLRVPPPGALATMTPGVGQSDLETLFTVFEASRIQGFDAVRARPFDRGDIADGNGASTRRLSYRAVFPQ